MDLKFSLKLEWILYEDCSFQRLNMRKVHSGDWKWNVEGKMVENFCKFANGMRGEREKTSKRKFCFVNRMLGLGLDLKVKIGWIGLTD